MLGQATDGTLGMLTAARDTIEIAAHVTLQPATGFESAVVREKHENLIAANEG